MAEEENNKIDLEALQNSIDESQNSEETSEKLDLDQENNESHEEEHDDFNLDEALDSFEPISLEGKISDEDAKKKAIERGWREDGKDKYGHNISAIEFLERTPLFHKMDLMRGDIEGIKRQNKKLTEQSKLVAKKSIDDQKKMLDDFKAEKKQLLANDILDKDDIDKLKVIDKKIEDHSIETKTELSDTEIKEITDEYASERQNFMDKNDWYESDYAMTTFANNEWTKHIHSFEGNGDVPPPALEAYQFVLDKVKEKFPDMDKPKRQTRVTTRNNRTVVQNHSKKKTIQDLPEDMQAVARNVMEAAGLSEDDYMATYEV